jgi:hypothetical protein
LVLHVSGLQLATCPIPSFCFFPNLLDNQHPLR